MKKLLLVVSFIAVLFVITGCDLFKGSTTAPKNYGGTLVYNTGVDPQTWDPSFNSAVDGGNLIENMFEGLYRSTPQGPKLAGALDYQLSADKKTYTFHLRQDAKWSNGEPVTSADYKFGWLRAIDRTNPSDYSYLVYPYIEGADCYFNGTGDPVTYCTADQVGISTPDDYTLVVKLTDPAPYFLHLLAFATYMPVYSKIGELPLGWEKNPATAVSNGPFKLQSYTIGDKIALVKNEYYWNKDNVLLDGINFLIIKDATTALTAYKMGNIDVLDAFNPSDIADLLSSDPNFKIETEVGTSYYNFNMDDPMIGEPAGENGLKIRQALSMAIDRKSIVDNVTKGYQIPAVAFVPPTVVYSDGTPCGLDVYGIKITAQVAQAQQLLLDAGIDTQAKKDALSAHLILGYNITANDGNRLVAEAIQQMWKNNLGINVQLQSEEWASFQESRQRGEYSIARAGWLGDYPDPNTMLDLFTSFSGLNDSQWRWKNTDDFSWDTTVNPTNKAFDDHIIAAKTSSGSVRDQHFKDAEKILLDNMVVMPIFWNSRMSTINTDRVGGVVRTLMGQWYFGDAYIVK